MKLEDMKRIAEGRTPGKWEHRFGDYHHGVYFGQSESQHIARSIAGRGNGGVKEEKANAEVIVMAINHLDKFIKLAEAAKSIFDTMMFDDKLQHHVVPDGRLNSLKKALEELEKE
jgi:hypothetical protein